MKSFKVLKKLIEDDIGKYTSQTPIQEITFKQRGGWYSKTFECLLQIEPDWDLVFIGSKPICVIGLQEILIPTHSWENINYDKEAYAVLYAAVTCVANRCQAFRERLKSIVLEQKLKMGTAYAYQKPSQQFIEPIGANFAVMILDEYIPVWLTDRVKVVNTGNLPPADSAQSYSRTNQTLRFDLS